MKKIYLLGDVGDEAFNHLISKSLREQKPTSNREEKHTVYEKRKRKTKH